MSDDLPNVHVTPVYHRIIISGGPGPGGSITVGTVTTGAPGSMVVVTDTGTPGAAILNFTIPRGDTGAGTPAGGTAHQLLRKVDGDDHHNEWFTLGTVNGKNIVEGNITLTPGDIGAATAAQGAKADTALQPGTTDSETWLDTRAIRFDKSQELGPDQQATAKANLGISNAGGGVTPEALVSAAGELTEAQKIEFAEQAKLVGSGRSLYAKGIEEEANNRYYVTGEPTDPVAVAMWFLDLNCTIPANSVPKENDTVFIRFENLGLTYIRYSVANLTCKQIRVSTAIEAVDNSELYISGVRANLLTLNIRPEHFTVNVSASTVDFVACQNLKQFVYAPEDFTGATPYSGYFDNFAYPKLLGALAGVSEAACYQWLASRGFDIYPDNSVIGSNGISVLDAAINLPASCQTFMVEYLGVSQVETVQLPYPQSNCINYSATFSYANGVARANDIAGILVSFGKLNGWLALKNDCRVDLSSNPEIVGEIQLLQARGWSCDVDGISPVDYGYYEIPSKPSFIRDYPDGTTVAWSTTHGNDFDPDTSLSSEGIYLMVYLAGASAWFYVPTDDISAEWPSFDLVIAEDTDGIQLEPGGVNLTQFENKQYLHATFQ